MSLLVIDESISTRIGTELRRRGRSAVSLAQLGLRGLEDDPMLIALAQRLDEPYVLVTADDAMPATHGATIDEVGTTVATLDPRWIRGGLGREAYKCEVVHRWAHAMAMQRPGTIRRYASGAHRLWTGLRRR